MLTSHDQAQSDLSAERLWLYVADPRQIMRWNKKLVAVDRASEGPVRQGETFTGRYRMSGPEQTCVTVVSWTDPPRAVSYDHSIKSRNRQLQVKESYRLEPNGSGTTVIQTLEMGPGIIPWWATWLVWLLMRFGKPVGLTTMQQLAKLAADDQAEMGR